MNRIHRISRIGLTTAVVLAAATGLAEGAWLVLADGAKIETRGPWQVKGGLVVFTNADGVLTSVRLSKCDLEASEAATEAAVRAAAASRTKAPPPPRRRPVLVLTDADVGHVSPVSGKDDQDEAADEAAGAGGVTVSDWQTGGGDDGVSITGMIRNDGANIAANIKLSAVFRDADGDPIESRAASLSTATLAPGQKAQFRVPAFGLFSYSTVDFDIQHFEILTGAGAAEAAPGGRR